MVEAVVLVVVAGAVGAAAALLLARRPTDRGGLTSPQERAVRQALHTASQAARPLRKGLTEASAAQAAPVLRHLLGAHAVAVAADDGQVLVWDGPDGHHRADFAAAAAKALATARSQLVQHTATACGRPGCAVRVLLAHPLVSDDGAAGGVLGVLGVASAQPATTGLLQAVAEVVGYVAGQVELAELDASRQRLAQAEVHALRAQISPHFIYNALTTIASFVRTDPDRARDLVLEFADFTRYSFRVAGEYTTLAEELANIDRYLTLERARFGPKLQVRLQVAPEVLGVVVPFLVLQPLVENAVRHGLSTKAEGGTISIAAADAGGECLVSVEDDGVGMDPALLRSGELNAATPDAPHVGLANVDGRLRAAFGDDYGLVVETAPGAGTKISLRVPKFRPGVRA